MAEEGKKKGLVKHILLARFKPECSQEQVATLISGYEALPSKIDEMKGFEWGADVSVENLHQDFTHVFCSTFDSPEGRDIYIAHPAHAAYAKELLSALEKVLVVDYHPKVVAESSTKS